MPSDAAGVQPIDVTTTAAGLIGLVADTHDEIVAWREHQRRVAASSPAPI